MSYEISWVIFHLFLVELCWSVFRRHLRFAEYGLWIGYHEQQALSKIFEAESIGDSEYQSLGGKKTEIGILIIDTYFLRCKKYAFVYCINITKAQIQILELHFNCCVKW